MTRAKDHLVLSVPRARVDEKGVRESAPSRYLRRVPRELFEIAK
jgi:hypothetical protein